MNLRRSSVGLFALTLAAGCTAPSTQYTIQPPPNLATAPEVHAAPLPVPSHGEVSLHDILAYADQHSPQLQVSRAARSQGDAELAAALPLLPSEPSLELSAGPRIGTDGTGIDLSLSLEQELEISGARALRIQAAQRFIDLKRTQLDQVRWMVHQQVHALFHQALVARDRAIAAAEFLRFAESLVSVAERRLKAGDISSLGLAVAQGEFAQAAQARIAADGSYRSAQLSLAEAAGWPATHIPIPAGELDVPRKTPKLEALLSLAAQENPQLHTSAAKTRVAEARAQVATRETWPTPTLGLQYTRESNPADGLGGAAESHVLLVGIRLPINMWRKNVGARSRAKAEVILSRAQYQSRKQVLVAQVRRTANRVDVEANRIAAYGSEILPTFEKNLAMLRKSFELGEIEILDVSVAQRRFLEIQQNALSAYQEYYEAVAALEQVVGADVWPDDRHDTQEDAK